MEKRNGFLTFLSALIPGVGYMYLGLVRKGIQVLLLFLLIGPVFSVLGIGGFLSFIVRLSIWIYAFFDTFNVAAKLDRGEHIEDTDFIFNHKGEGYPVADRVKLNKNFMLIAAWALIIIGIMAIVNKLFEYNNLYILITGYMSKYFLPVILVLAGVYMLFKNKE